MYIYVCILFPFQFYFSKGGEERIKRHLFIFLMDYYRRQGNECVIIKEMER